jgi:hypothetical protein
MDIDIFCKSFVSEYSNSTYDEEDLDMAEIETDLLPNIIILIENVTDNRSQYTEKDYQYTVSLAFVDGDKVIHSLLSLYDIEDFIDGLDFSNKQSFIELHNYCARRFREIIVAMWPNINIGKIGKR